MPRGAWGIPLYAALPEPPAERYPLIEIPHGGPGPCPYPSADPPRSWCDRCDAAMKINERRVLIFDHTPGAGPWPGTCTVARCQNMILTGDLCAEHYGERLRSQRRRNRAGAA